MTRRRKALSCEGRDPVFRPRLALVLCAAGLGGLALAAAAAATPGALDPTFGQGGRVRTDLVADAFQLARAAALQPDGKIVVAGSTPVAGVDRDFFLARYNPDGSLDPSFGVGGFVTTDLAGGSADEAQAVALQSDGRIVVAGSSGASAGADFALARYLPNGALDPSFGAGGIVLSDLAGAGSASAYDVAIQPDGRIVAVGDLALPIGLSGFDGAVARYLSDGALDGSFGTGGVQSLPGLLLERERLTGAHLPGDGTILLVGWQETGAGSLVLVARLLADGSLDPAFDGDGIECFGFGGFTDQGSAVTTEASGRILVAGTKDSAGPDGDFGLARLLSDGSLDPTFGTAGIVTTDAGDHDTATDLALEPDGRVLVTGTSGTAGADFAVARYLPDGLPDPAFGGGVVTADLFGGSRDSSTAAVLQPDGRLVLAGTTRDPGDDSDVALARFLLVTLAPQEIPVFDPAGMLLLAALLALLGATRLAARRRAARRSPGG